MKQRVSTSMSQFAWQGERCTSVNGEPGMCVPIVKPYFGGGGCKCGASSMERDGWPSAALVLGALLFATQRRRRDCRARRSS